MEFTESDYLPHELNTGGFCICLRGKSRVTLNQHRCYIQKGDLCVFFPRMLMQLDDHSDDFEAYYVSLRSTSHAKCRSLRRPRCSLTSKTIPYLARRYDFPADAQILPHVQ